MPASSFLDNLLLFGRLLRHHGLAVHTGRLLDLAQALQHIDLSRRDDVYLACRTVLIQRHEDFAAFDRAFNSFFGGLSRRRPPDGSPAAPEADPAGLGLQPVGTPDTGADESVAPDTVAVRTWSDAETIASRDFASLTAAEQAVANAAIAQLTITGAERRSRRWVRRGGPRIDLRRALANSLRTGGEITALPRQRRRTKPRPAVLLCDVSGSMAQYSRTLLHFAHTLSRQTRRVEAFVFATRLTRITGELRARGADAALAAAARAVSDWSGGTRIGAALHTFHQRWRRALNGAPIVLLISDGWDRGDPELLRQQIARLQRRCHRLIWLNPHIGTEDFAPLTRGLQAALPHVDDFLPVRTLSDVRDLALHLGRLDGR